MVRRLSNPSIPGKLAGLCGRNQVKAQAFATALKRTNTKLQGVSLPVIYARAQEEFKIGVKALQQDALHGTYARQVLGILEPSSSIGKYEACDLPPMPINRELVLRVGTHQVRLNLRSIRFYVDKHFPDGSPPVYTIGTVYTFNQTPAIRRLAKKPILVGRRMGDPIHRDTQEQRMALLKKRIVKGLFGLQFDTGSDMALIEIREHLARTEAEVIQPVFNRIIAGREDIITEILLAAKRGTTESDGQILEVTL